MRRDPWLPARMRAHATLARGEHRLHTALVTAITVWLDTARALVLGQPVPGVVTADGGPTPDPDPDALWASLDAWTDALEQHVEPVIADAFGAAFAHEMRTADISPLHWQEQHMATVHDRLKIWPEGSFEELRYELLEAMAAHEDIDQVQDRIGRILNIDAPARRIRAEISAVDRQLADPDTPPARLPILKGKRRKLWNQHDERNLEWQWLARRIARTEIQGAIEGGALAAAQAAEEETSEPMYKRFLSTHDERTRLSHSVADGQMVRLTEPFIVGGAPLMHPADPMGPAHEVINCRCSMAILSWGEMQAELQGMWGGRGVGPMNARLGPDDEAEVAAAIDRLKREQRGEVIEDTTAPATTATDAEDLARKYEEDKHSRQTDGKSGKKAAPSAPDGGGEPDTDGTAPEPRDDAPTTPKPGAPDVASNHDSDAPKAPATALGTEKPKSGTGGEAPNQTPQVGELTEVREGVAIPIPGLTRVTPDEVPDAKEAPSVQPIENLTLAPQDDPFKYCESDTERDMLAQLRSYGTDYVSVQRTGDKTPDFASLQLRSGVDHKEIGDGKHAIRRNLILASFQGRGAIIDASAGTRELAATIDHLASLIATEVGIGPYLDEIAILLAAGGIYWSRDEL